jgi:hypothetical protein
MTSSKIILYQTQGSDITIDVVIENDAVWLTQNQIGFLLRYFF